MDGKYSDEFKSLIRDLECVQEKITVIREGATACTQIDEFLHCKLKCQELVNIKSKIIGQGLLDIMSAVGHNLFK